MMRAFIEERLTIAILNKGEIINTNIMLILNKAKGLQIKYHKFLVKSRNTQWLISLEMQNRQFDDGGLEAPGGYPPGTNGKSPF